MDNKIKPILTIAEFATNNRMKMFSVPLKDNYCAKFLFNQKIMDVFILKNGKYKNAQGINLTKNISRDAERIGQLFETIQKVAAKGIDVTTEFGKAILSNVK